MKKRVTLSGLLVLILLVIGFAVPAFAATPDNVHGLVFIDDNLNGVWDAGEAGYGGEYLYDNNAEEFRYVGATITLLSPAYDDFELESASFRELGENEEVVCSQQDTIVNDEFVEEEYQMRPCSGTWGLPGTSNDIRWEVTVTAPDGYYLTSENPQYFTTGANNAPLDFGIAPIE